MQIWVETVFGLGHDSLDKVPTSRQHRVQVILDGFSQDRHGSGFKFRVQMSWWWWLRAWVTVPLLESTRPGLLLTGSGYEGRLGGPAAATSTGTWVTAWWHRDSPGTRVSGWVRSKSAAPLSPAAAAGPPRGPRWCVTVTRPLASLRYGSLAYGLTGSLCPSWF